MKDWKGTATNEAQDIEFLDHLQNVLEKLISNYALEEIEDVYDVDEDIVLRGLKWGRGNKNYWIVISPLGHIRYTEGKIPSNLLVQMHNAFMEVMIEAVRIVKDK